MRSIWMAVMAGGLVAMSAAGADNEIVLRVRRGSVPRFFEVKYRTSRILESAGVRVRWERRVAESSTSECGRVAADVHTIDIDIRDESSKSDHPGALGYALPFERGGVRVVVFGDRVEWMHGGPELMGHVLAHEVGHMLMGMNRHAERGVMKAQFRPIDVELMVRHPLAFIGEDVEMIRLNLAAQEQACREATLVASAGR